MGIINVLFVYGHFYSGGSETLILRLARYFKKKGIGVTISCIDMIDDMHKKFDELEIDVYLLRELECNKRVLMQIDEVITFGDYDFLRYESLRERNQFNYVTLLYVIHPFTLTEWSCKKNNKFMSKKVDEIHADILKKYIVNGNVFFMDTECKENTFKSLKIDISNIGEICPIPFEFDLYDAHLVKRKADLKKERFTILTVARADFPFKGYIKGLIEDVSKLTKKYKNVYLTIISYGSGLEDIYDWIAQSDCENISLIERIDYDLLPDMYRNAHLYVGMGTTLIEAVNGSSIAIPVESYTYECSTTRYFDENVEWLSVESGTGNSVLPYIELIINQEPKVYIEQIGKIWRLVSDYYGIEKATNYLINKPQLLKERCIEKRHQRVIYWMYELRKFLKPLR